MKVSILLSALFIISMATGCTVLKKRSELSIENDTKQTSKQKGNASIANVETQLLAAAQSIEQSLSTLAAAEKTENVPILNTEALVTPEGGMGGLADIDWTGPLGPLVEKIANMT